MAVPISKPYNINLTGKLLPWSDGPCLLVFSDSDASILPVFSTESLLREALKDKLPFERIKQIMDGRAFLQDIPTKTPDGHPVRIVLDLRFVGDGKHRYTEILRD